MSKPKDAWRAATPASSAPGLPGRRKPAGNPRRWLLAALVVLGLGGVLAGLFFFMRPDPDPVLLALPVSEYADPGWPPNPWAVQEARAYGERFGDDSTKAFPDQEKARLLRALAQLAEDSRGAKKGQPIVAILTILGVARDGVPYLLPADAKPDDPSMWLKLDDILQPLRKTDVPRLLILDVRPVASLSTSDVNDELGTALAKLESANDLPFLVLNAATPSVGPASVKPLKRTAFGLALNQGLGGHADGWNPEHTKDNRVSVKELAAYVREVTYTSAKAFGHPPQLPKLYGTGKDFHLRHVPTGGPVAMPTLAEPEAVPDWWTESEKFHDAWAKSQGARRLPNIVIEGNLAREQALAAWMAGYDPSAIAARFAPKEQARRAAMAAAPPVTPPPHTLAKMRTSTEFTAKVAAAQTLLAPVFDKIRDGTGKPEDLMAVQGPAWAKAAEHPGEAVCEAALKFAVALEDVKFHQVKTIAATVAGFRPKAKPFEWSVFELVAGFDPELVKQWPKGTLRRMMLLIPTMGEAIATDGRNLPWIRTAAEASLTKATQALVALGSSDSSDAEMRDAAPRLDEARQENVRVKAAAAVLTAARIESEDARAELSDLGGGFPHEFAAIPADVARTWAALADAFTKAEALLAPPANAAALPALEPFSQAKDGVQVARTSLRAMVKVPDDATASQLGRALAWTGWGMAERAALIARYDAVSRAAATKILNAWPSSPSGLELPPPAKAFQPAVTLTPELRPNAGWTQPAEEQKYQEWLGRTVYPTMAAAWRTLKTDAATEAAKNLERIARESLDWRAGAKP
jgi:hypothetical protein